MTAAADNPLPPAVAAYDERAEDYDAWYDENEALYRAELNLIEGLLTPLQVLGSGLEIGAGTGRFTAPLGIETGLEPSPQMGHLARQRGVHIVPGLAEDLPFADGSFAYTAFFTSLCFVPDRGRALAQAHRVTRPGGGVVIAFLNRASELGQNLQATKDQDPYYATAELLTLEELTELLSAAGYDVEQSGQLNPGPGGQPMTSIGANDGLYCVLRARRR